MHEDYRDKSAWVCHFRLIAFANWNNSSTTPGEPSDLAGGKAGQGKESMPDKARHPT